MTDPHSNFLILMSNILQEANSLQEVEMILRKFLRQLQDQYNLEHCSLFIASSSDPSKEIKLSTQPETKNLNNEMAVNNNNPPIVVIQSSVKNDYYCILEIQRHDRKPYTNEELFGFQLLTNQITVFVENVFLHDSLSRRFKHEQKVLEINQRLRSTSDMQELLQYSVEELQRLIGASQVQIILKRSEDDHPGI